jgi:uncharacterized protein YndB with AHSA1/START domain
MHDSGTQDREMVITRDISAPRDLVWRAWTEPEHLIQWWGPDGFTNTFHEISVKPGGIWRFMMHGPDGTDYPNKIIFTKLVKPERIEYTHSDDEVKVQHFDTVVTLDDLGNGKTRVTMKVLFVSKEEFDKVKGYAVQGGNQTLGKLADHVAGMQ